MNAERQRRGSTVRTASRHPPACCAACALVGEQLDGQQPEHEAADVREVRDAAAALAGSR